MSLLEQLRRNTRRIEQYRQASQQEPIRQNATRAYDDVAVLSKHWTRLNQLASLPPELAPTAVADTARARTVLDSLLGSFEAYEAGSSAKGLLRWANSLPGSAHRIERLVEQVENAGRDAMEQRLRMLDNAAFLAQELGIDDAATAAAREGARRELQEGERVLDGRASTPLTFALSWSVAWSQYEEVAGVRACLRQAALPAQLAGTIQQLLVSGSVALSAVDQHALVALAESPALARLCSIQLRKDGQ